MFASFIPPPPLARARLVRRKAGVPFYVDDKHPEYGEFTISGTAPQVKKKSKALKLAMHATHERFPNFGEYFVDKEGREVFTNNGKPFYVGYHNGRAHKVFSNPACHAARRLSARHAGLLNHPRAGETNQSFWFGNNDVTHERKTCADAAGRRVGEDADKW